jgi:hypothetical protein
VLIALVAQLHLAVLLAHVQAQPAQVGVDRAGAGDDAKALAGQPRHRQIGDDPAALVEELRVDHAAHRAIDAAVADALEQRQRARAADRDLAERREVDDPDALAKRPVLLGKQLQVGGRAPAEPPLVLARSPPWCSRLEVVGSLPAVLGAEHGAELLEADVQRAQPPPAPGLRAVERVAQPVVVPVGLARGLLGKDAVAVDRAEAPRPVGVDVDLARAVGHPLGQAPAHPAGAAEAVERQAGGDPEAARAGHRSHQRIAVGRHRVGMAEQADHPGVLEEREATDRALEQRREAVDVRRHRAGPVIPGHPVDPARDRVRLVAADQHAARLALPVDEVVGVAEAGGVACHLVAGNGSHRDVLVIDRHRRDEGADHRRHLWRPDAGSVDDALGLDRPVVGEHGAHFAARPELDPAHPRAEPDLDAERARGIGDRVGRDVRVDVAVAGHPHAAEDRAGVRPGKSLEDLLR